MSFNILAVREIGAADSSLYPVPGETPDQVQPETQDGQAHAALTSTEIQVSEAVPGRSPKRVLSVNKVKAAVTITEARVIVACSKYEKGGGFTPWTVAAVPFAVTANVISKVRASRGRRGKMLVGQVRYPWLLSVGCRERSTSLGHDTLRLGILDPSEQGRALTLDIHLPRQESGVELARQITCLAARHRLEGESDIPELREHISELTDPPPLQPAPKEFSSYVFFDASQSGLVKSLQA